MKLKSRKSGFTLIEILVGTLCMSIVGLGILTLIRTGYDSQWMLMNQNDANTWARSGIDTMIDKVRGMASLTSAAANDITFADSNGNAIRYWVNTGDHTLRTTSGGNPSGGTIVARGAQTLSFNYWSYIASAWSASNTPASTATVGVIDITANVTLNGYTRQVFSSAKLRQIRFSNANGF